jgi:hypothetical protein
MTDNALPRRRIVVNLRIGADSWDELRGTFRELETQIAMYGKLSSNAVSGGYSSGYILDSNEDESITHDSWFEANEAYCNTLRAEEIQ